MGQMRGLEPPNTGTTIRGLNRLATPAIKPRQYYTTRVWRGLSWLPAALRPETLQLGLGGLVSADGWWLGFRDGQGAGFGYRS